MCAKKNARRHHSLNDVSPVPPCVQCCSGCVHKCCAAVRKKKRGPVVFVQWSVLAANIEWKGCRGKRVQLCMSFTPGVFFAHTGLRILAINCLDKCVCQGRCAGVRCIALYLNGGARACSHTQDPISFQIFVWTIVFAKGDARVFVALYCISTAACVLVFVRKAPPPQPARAARGKKASVIAIHLKNH